MAFRHHLCRFPPLWPITVSALHLLHLVGLLWVRWRKALQFVDWHVCVFFSLNWVLQRHGLYLSHFCIIMPTTGMAYRKELINTCERQRECGLKDTVILICCGSPVCHPVGKHVKSKESWTWVFLALSGHFMSGAHYAMWQVTGLLLGAIQEEWMPVCCFGFTLKTRGF